MSGVVLVIVQSRRGAILEASFSAIGAGRALADAYDGRLMLGVIDPEPASIIDALQLDGVDEIVYTTVEGDGFAPEAHEAATIQLGQHVGALAIVFGHTVDAMAFAPSLAAQYELGLATDVIRVGVEDGDVSAVRAAYRGQLNEEMVFPHACVVLTVRGGAYESPQRRGDGTVPVTEIESVETELRTAHREWIDPAIGGVDITKADFLLSVGRAIGSAENVDRAGRLATALGGVLSASRPVIDSGWTEPYRQVGQTGKTVKPKVYLALGISGAVQHMAGMANSGIVIAVNTDPSAPMFSRADYTVEMDILDLLDALEVAAATGPDLGSAAS